MICAAASGHVPMWAARLLCRVCRCLWLCLRFPGQGELGGLSVCGCGKCRPWCCLWLSLLSGRPMMTWPTDLFYHLPDDL